MQKSLLISLFKCKNIGEAKKWIVNLEVQYATEVITGMLDEQGIDNSEEIANQCVSDNLETERK